MGRAGMADRMTSVEIEDVLSSIRRLVTDDLRPKPVIADSKLILTPALRVVPDVPPQAEGDADAAQDINLDADLTEALQAETHVDAHEPADAEAEAEVPDHTFVDAEPVAFPMFLHHDRRVDLPSEGSAPDAEDVHDVGETVSAIAAGIPADGYESELGDVMPVPDWPESSWVAPDVIDVVEEAELIVAVEAVSDAPHADWMPEPQLQVDDLFDEHDADIAAAAVMADLAAQEAGGLTEMDEDMLREIVRDIIREELQGTLGERITRNVRKLVRAEINRAMLTQDIE
jgi:hypothetical protein